ncbi:MAG: hypothetical protein U0175_15390 [Caldilineaceae bacterium]
MQNVTPDSNPVEDHPVFFSRERNSKLIWGILLIVGGFFFLLQQFSIFSFVSDLVWVALFAGGAVFFAGWFLRNPRLNWWAAIPGFTLAGLATVSLIDQFNISALNDLSGPLFLASIGLGFAVIFLVNPEMWWALIPGGVMMTLAVVAYADEIGTGVDSGALLFFGLGLTFAAIGALPGRHGKPNRWAFYPAVALLAMGFLIAFSMEYSIQYLWPILLIGGGLFLIGRTLLKNRSRA